MQSLVIFLTVPILAISAALMPEDIVRFGIVRQKCDREITVDPTSMERARAGEQVHDPNFNCYVACFLEGMQLLRPDGKLDADAAIDKVPNTSFHDDLVGAITSCADQSVINFPLDGRDKCDTARRLLACMHAQGVPNMLKM